MKLSNKNGLRILTPESPEFMLYNTRTNSYCEKVYLGVNDSVENYREIAKELIEFDNKENRTKVEELQAIIDRQNAAISELSRQLEELASIIKKED